MRFKLHTQSALKNVKIDWTAEVELTAELRAAMGATDVDAMQAGVLLRGVEVKSVTYPRGTIVFRVAHGHEHFVQMPGPDPVVVPVATIAASWSVERTGTLDRYKGTLGTRDEGERLDIVIAASLSDLSRAKVQRLIENGHVRVAGQAAVRSNLRVRAGDAVEVDVELSVVN